MEQPRLLEPEQERKAQKIATSKNFSTASPTLFFFLFFFKNSPVSFKKLVKNKTTSVTIPSNTSISKHQKSAKATSETYIENWTHCFYSKDAFPASANKQEQKTANLQLNDDNNSTTMDYGR